jgi:hypothetical protein
MTSRNCLERELSVCSFSGVLPGSGHLRRLSGRHQRRYSETPQVEIGEGCIEGTGNHCED